MQSNRFRYFRWTPRTAWITVAYVVVVPSIVGLLAYRTDVSIACVSLVLGVLCFPLHQSTCLTLPASGISRGGLTFFGTGSLGSACQEKGRFAPGVVKNCAIDDAEDEPEISSG